jgi:hypothetical protein
MERGRRRLAFPIHQARPYTGCDGILVAIIPIKVKALYWQLHLIRPTEQQDSSRLIEMQRTLEPHSSFAFRNMYYFARIRPGLTPGTPRLRLPGKMIFREQFGFLGIPGQRFTERPQVMDFGFGIQSSPLHRFIASLYWRMKINYTYTIRVLQQIPYSRMRAKDRNNRGNLAAALAILKQEFKLMHNPEIVPGHVCGESLPKIGYAVEKKQVGMPWEDRFGFAIHTTLDVRHCSYTTSATHPPTRNPSLSAAFNLAVPYKWRKSWRLLELVVCLLCTNHLTTTNPTPSRARLQALRSA